MKKYFRTKEEIEQTKKLKLSEYLKMDSSEFKYYVCQEKYKEPRIEYFIDILGDVELDEDTYRLFMKQFDILGGRYDVRADKETIKGVYDISQKYPSLTYLTLDQIFSVYIHDLFEEYALDEMLGKYIELHGETEDALDDYLGFVDRKAEEFDIKYFEEMEKLEKYKDEYGESLIKDLQYLIKRRHLLAEDIEKALPSKELIEKDTEQLHEIVKATRIYMGMCTPISQQMIESMASGKGLDRFPEQPAYQINSASIIPATFTKQEFLDSVEKRLANSEKPVKK